MFETRNFVLKYIRIIPKMKKGEIVLMSKKSIKSNKSVYQQAREKLGLSREQASNVIQYLSPERIERIENGKTTSFHCALGLFML